MHSNARMHKILDVLVDSFFGLEVKEYFRVIFERFLFTYLELFLVRNGVHDGNHDDTFHRFDL